MFSSCLFSRAPRRRLLQLLVLPCFRALSSQFSVLNKTVLGTTENRELTTGLCLCRLLLLRDRAFARTFAGTSVGVRALPANRQVPAMTESAIRPDFDEPLDVHRNVFAQIAFHPAFRLDNLANAVALIFCQVLHFLHRVHFRCVQNTRRA